MTHEKWFISDTHFFHANILKFTGKDGKRIRHEFQSLDEMHEYMIAKWNSKVSPNDYIYHLGDVTFRYDGAFNNLMSRLNGKKRLVVGNHDKMKNPALFKWFDKVDLWKGFSEKQTGLKYGFTASHFPLQVGLLRDGKHNVHGHIHRNSSPEKHQINVSVEVRDYTPVHIDTIIEEIKQLSA